LVKISQKKGKTKVLPYILMHICHYSAAASGETDPLSSVAFATSSSVAGASAAFLGAAGALLLRVFLAGSAAAFTELP
jgi:hypothetical protein